MKTTKYFPHDADYLDDPRIIKLIERYKMAGYGILFSLYEMLLKHEDYRFHHSEIRMHCRRINVKTVLVKSVLNDFDLFSFDGEYYSSDDFSQKMKNYDDKKRKNILKKEVEEKANLLKLNQQKSEYDALLNDIESNRIKLNRIEGDEEKKKENEPTDDDTPFSDSIIQPGAVPEADRNLNFAPHSEFAPASDAEVHAATGLAVSQPPASTRGNGKMSDEEYEKLALKNSLDEMEAGVDRAFRDQCWLGVIAMNQHMPIEYIHQIPVMSRVFKDHIIQQGKVRAMSDPEEAKRYFANFARDGAATRTTLDERMRMRLRKEVPYPFEDVDPVTGQRSVCGVPVPRNAPPRPDYSMRWNVEKKKWTH